MYIFNQKTDLVLKNPLLSLVPIRDPTTNGQRISNDESYGIRERKKERERERERLTRKKNQSGGAPCRFCLKSSKLPRTSLRRWNIRFNVCL